MRKGVEKTTHASMPDDLYIALLTDAKEKAKKGDSECRRWLSDELITRHRELTIKEFDKMRRKGLNKEYKGMPCAICGNPSDTIDHIVPVSYFGTNDKSNLQPMCRECNSKKSNALIDLDSK